jgi:hypothetical protein
MTFYKFALEWVKKQFKPFTIYDIKRSFIDPGNKPVEELSYYGGVMKELSRLNLIIHNGYVKTKRPNGKHHLVNQWISREYSQKQRENATKNVTLKMDL